jgi:hypothetical protein
VLAVLRRLAPYLLLLGFFGAAYAAPNTLYQRLPRLDDELANLWLARVYALGRLSAPAAPVPAAFAVTHIIDYGGHRFSKYAPGFSLILTPSVWMGEPWITNPWLFTVVLAVFYRWARSLLGSRVALYALVLGATSPFWLMLAATLMPHGLSLLAGTLFIAGAMQFVGLNQPPRRRPTGLAVGMGVALGVVFFTRPFTAFCLALPLGGVAAWQLFRRPRATLRRYAPLLLGLAPFPVALLWHNYHFTGQWTFSLYAMAWPQDLIGFGPDRGHFGYTPAEAVDSLWLGLNALNLDLHGWLFVSLTLPALGLALPPYHKRDWFLVAFPAAIILGYMAYFHQSRVFGPRYYVEATAPLMALSALGLHKAWRWLSAHLARKPASLWRALRALALVTAILCLAFDLLFYIPFRFNYLANPPDYHQQLSWAPVEAARAAQLTNAIVLVPSERWITIASGNLTNSVLLNDDVLYACYVGPEIYNALRAIYPDRVLYYWVAPNLFPASAPLPGGGQCDI